MCFRAPLLSTSAPSPGEDVFKSGARVGDRQLDGFQLGSPSAEVQLITAVVAFRVSLFCIIQMSKRGTGPLCPSHSPQPRTCSSHTFSPLNFTFRPLTLHQYCTYIHYVDYTCTHCVHHTFAITLCCITCLPSHAFHFQQEMASDQAHIKKLEEQLRAGLMSQLKVATWFQFQHVFRLALCLCVPLDDPCRLCCALDGYCPAVQMLSGAWLRRLHTEPDEFALQFCAWAGTVCLMCPVYACLQGVQLVRLSSPCITNCMHAPPCMRF